MTMKEPAKLPEKLHPNPKGDNLARSTLNALISYLQEPDDHQKDTPAETCVHTSPEGTSYGLKHECHEPKQDTSARHDELFSHRNGYCEHFEPKQDTVRISNLGYDERLVVMGLRAHPTACESCGVQAGQKKACNNDYCACHQDEPKQDTEKFWDGREWKTREQLEREEKAPWDGNNMQKQDTEPPKGTITPENIDAVVEGEWGKDWKTRWKQETEWEEPSK